MKQIQHGNFRNKLIFEKASLNDYKQVGWTVRNSVSSFRLMLGLVQRTLTIWRNQALSAWVEVGLDQDVSCREATLRLTWTCQEASRIQQTGSVLQSPVQFQDRTKTLLKLHFLQASFFCNYAAVALELVVVNIKKNI